MDKEIMIGEMEYGVPIPPVYISKYSWLDKMEVGANILTKNISSGQLASAFSGAGRRTGFRYEQRKEGDCRRVWRIE